MRSTNGVHERLIPLDSEQATLALAGGKGTNLARLARAGFRVPDGFILTTFAYDAFIAAHGLEPRIEAALLQVGARPDPPQEGLERVSEKIARLIEGHAIDPSLADAIAAAYAKLGRPAVAVRSSATTEDLPDLSFAGQQATLLNVLGEEQLLEAVVACWVSLWTPRAIGYRARNQIGAGGLAVVIQRMVESTAAGVMFTAHPVTGDRRQIVIEATHGLGESLVSGQVEPDRFTVDGRALRIIERSIGSKRVAVRARPAGGTDTLADRPDGSATPSIDDERILELARTGTRIAALYGTPQDIEWALGDDTLYLLQSRAITSLFPLPAEMPPQPLQVMVSLAAIQGLMDPFTPLGADMLRQVFASASRIFGYRRTRRSQRVIATAGERLWVNFTSLLGTTTGRKAVRGGLALLEPTVAQALEKVWGDPELGPVRPPTLRARLRLLRFVVPLAANLLFNLAAPRRRRKRLERRGEGILEHLRAEPQPTAQPLARLAGVAASVAPTFDKLIPPTFVRLVAGVATGMASLHLLNRTARRSGAEAVGSPMADVVLEATRGVPNNPTTEMDLALWEIAKIVRRSEEAGDASRGDRPRQRPLRAQSARELAEQFAAGRLPSPVQVAVSHFLDRYGARGLAELDAGRPRWRDEPQQLFAMLEGYLKIEDARLAPDAVFARSARRAAEAVEHLARTARQSRPGPCGAARAARVRFAARRARAFLGFREYPKFFAVRMMDLIRTRLLGVGADLAAAGVLQRPEDLFFLDLTELEELGRGILLPSAAGELIEARRECYRQELRRNRIPRLLLSDGRAFFDGIAEPALDDGAAVPGADGRSRPGGGALQLSGSPVSPGTVEGRVRVVLDPRSSGLEPGEIMVCRGTDPSWTPLFLIAAGLVMEVGGMMTHGAVVAREYGIPALVGVHEATGRLTTGQTVRLDGSTGTIILIDPQA